MFSNLFEDGKSFLARTFPERQIYLRSGGEVSYHTIKTRTQVMLATVVSLVLFWCLLTIFNLIWGNSPLRTPAQQGRLVKAEYQRLLEDAEARYENAQLQLTQQQEAFERAAQSFQEKHDALAQFVNQPLTSDIASNLANAENATGRIQLAPVTRDALPRTARRQYVQMASLETGTAVDAPLEALGKDQTNVLLTAESMTHDKIEWNRAIIEATTFSINELLSLGEVGTGGPLIENDESLEGNDTDPLLSQIKARAIEAQRLEAAVQALPLGHPVASEHYRTSSFGLRKDPFTKRPAMHNAVDFASYRMAPIVATADGTVKFSGVRSGYGRVVEVDHGYGFITRYAHLAKSYVKRGQTVKQGEKLGGMGSTGRSTSTHLHYEIRFQGKATNPDNFLKAGRYVQQN